MTVVVVIPYGGRLRPTEIFGFTRTLARLSSPAKPSQRATASRSDLRWLPTLTIETAMVMLPVQSVGWTALSPTAPILLPQSSDSFASREEEGSETVAPRHGRSVRSCR